MDICRSSASLNHTINNDRYVGKKIVLNYELHHFSRGVCLSPHSSVHVFQHCRQSVANAEMKNVNSLHFETRSLYPQSNGSLCICMRQVTPDFYTALGKVFLYPVTQLILNIDSQFVPRITLWQFGNVCMPSSPRQGKLRLAMIWLIYLEATVSHLSFLLYS